MDILGRRSGIDVVYAIRDRGYLTKFKYGEYFKIIIGGR